MSNYSTNDYRSYQKKNSDDSLAHSWGTSPEQKAKEREYNHRYWMENRDRIMRQRQGRNVDVTDSGTGTADNVFRQGQINETARRSITQGYWMNNGYDRYGRRLIDPSRDTTRSHELEEDPQRREVSRSGISGGSQIDYAETQRQMNEALDRQDRNFATVETRTAHPERLTRNGPAPDFGQISTRGKSAIQQQSSTPMSRVQSAVNAGKAAVANVLDQISDWAASAADSLRKK